MSTNIDQQCVRQNATSAALPSTPDTQPVISEHCFHEARGLAYACLSALEEVLLASGELSTYINKPAVFSLDGVALLPADEKHSRVTRAVEFLCKVLDCCGAQAVQTFSFSPQTDWDDSGIPDKILRIRPWLIQVCAGGEWRGLNTAHEKAYRRAFELWSKIETAVSVASYRDSGPSVKGPGFCLSLELVEQYVAEFQEELRKQWDLDGDAAKADIDRESFGALAKWKAEVGARSKGDSESASNRDAIAKEPDGPGQLGWFNWQGTPLSGLQPVPWRLVNELWHAKNRTRSIDDLAEPVWNDHSTVPFSRNEPGKSSADLEDNALRSARSKANRFFQKNGVPYRVRVRGESVSLKSLKS